MRFFIFIYFFVFVSLSADEPSATCPKFLEEISFFKKARLIYRYDSAGTAAVIQAAAGVQAPIKLEDAIKTVQGWIENYKSYKKDLEDLRRALRRYDGEDSRFISDGLRLKGRINILKEALAAKVFPADLMFPMAPQIEGGRAIVPRGGDLLTTWRFQDNGELKRFLSDDKKSRQRIERLLIEREIEQAVLFTKIRQFIQRFPEDKILSIKARVTADRQRVVTSSGTDTDFLDFKSIQVAPLLLVSEASAIVNDTSSFYVELRPTRRSLSFVEKATNSDILHGFISKPHWLNGFKKRGVEFNSRVGTFLDWMSNYQKRLFILATVSVIFTQTTDMVKSVYGNVVVPVHDWVVYDAKEFKEKQKFDELKELSKEIGDPASDILKFDKRFLPFAQKKWDDEAVTIAFEHFAGIRAKPEADPVRDAKWNSGKLGGYTAQAKEITAIRNILLEGTNSPYGTIVGAATRFGGRSYNEFLLKEAAEHFYKEKGLPPPDQLNSENGPNGDSK